MRWWHRRQGPSAPRSAEADLQPFQPPQSGHSGHGTPSVRRDHCAALHAAGLHCSRMAAAAMACLLGEVEEALHQVARAHGAEPGRTGAQPSWSTWPFMRTPMVVFSEFRSGSWVCARAAPDQFAATPLKAILSLCIILCVHDIQSMFSSNLGCTSTLSAKYQRRPTLHDTAALIDVAGSRHRRWRIRDEMRR